MIQLQLQPLGNDPQLQGADGYGVPVWGAYGFDPQFNASTAGPPLSPGWYTARARIDGRSGNIEQPKVYIPDAQGNYAERRSVTMKRRGADWEAVFHIGHPFSNLRFDPSQAPCEFACGALELAPRAAATGLRGWFERFAPARPASRAPLRTPWPKGTARRKALVLAQIDRDRIGLEIGPGHDPIAPKREGFKVHVIDHTTREGLREKYKAHKLALDRIEEVDFVWNGQSYLELTGRPKHYDWLIASNVIEHTTDLIAFLQDCDAILKDDGVLCLVVPDKRYCFDRFRPITGLARIIDAHFADSKVHSPGVVAEYFMNVVGRDHKLSWSAWTRGDYYFIHSAKLAAEGIRQVREQGSYLDVHDWCFVPHSFRLLMHDLYTLGYTRLREVSFHPTEDWEFHVTLGRRGAGPDLSRLELLRAIDAEQAAVDRS